MVVASSTKGLGECRTRSEAREDKESWLGSRRFIYVCVS